MDGTLLLTADNDPFRRDSLARFFSENGFRVAGPDCSSKPVRRAELLSRILAAFSDRLRPGDGNGRTPPAKVITRARAEEGIE